MSLPRLDPATSRAYLDRLGLASADRSPEGLAELQRAHLLALPFHNLALLANDGADPGLPAVERAVAANIAGVGGTCHLQTPPFAALLAALDFDVTLAAATIRRRDDHLVAVVTLDGERFLCDVGNGHPYLRPWRLAAGSAEQRWYGWRFRCEQIGADEYELSRELPDGCWHPIYRTEASPRTYASFGATIREHHMQRDYGPFLSGLRASRITSTCLLTLRDERYQRYDGLVTSDRRVVDRERTQQLLHARFGLPTELIEPALETLARRRPELWSRRSRLFAVPEWEFAARRERWTPEALGTLTREMRSVGDEDCPQVLLAVAVTDRPASLKRLLESVDAERDRFAYAGEVGVLIIDNSTSSAATRALLEHAEAARTPSVVVSAGEFDVRLATSARLGVLPPPSRPLPIAAAREATLAALHRHWATPWPTLPHPARGPLAVWIVDDDMALYQLLEDRRIERVTSLFHRIARIRLERPEFSVLLGEYTGDPPIPGLDALGVQLVDLRAHVALALADGLDAPWRPPPPAQLTDPYYDLSEGSSEHLSIPYWWRSSAPTICAALIELLTEFPAVLRGQQVTRPLTWDGIERSPRPSLRRGGNAVFLDLDALFAWPTPSVRCRDGIMTRRGDTIWATLAHADPDYDVAEVSLPLHHGRFEQTLGSPLPTTDAGTLTNAQVRGTALARAIGTGVAVSDALRRRIDRVESQRLWVAEQIQGARLELEALASEPMAPPRLLMAIEGGLRALDAIEVTLERARPSGGCVDELTAVAVDLQDRIFRWRESWRCD